MPNVFQTLSAQIRLLKTENEELKRNTNGGKSYIKELFKMTFLNIKLKKWLDMGEETNTKLKETIERMNADLNALSNLMDAPPKYEEVVSNPLKIQAIMRGFLTRKNTNAKCCVCYDKCFKKNTCCNSFLCGECRPRCNGKCPMCRTRFQNQPNNGFPHYGAMNGMFDPLSDSEDEEEDGQPLITELILNPTRENAESLVMYNTEQANDFRFWIQLSPYRNIGNIDLRRQYRDLRFEDIPISHQFRFSQNWGMDLLDFLDGFGIIDLNRMRNGEVDRYCRQFAGYRYGERITIQMVNGASGSYDALENIVDMPSHWTNPAHSPQVYRMNTYPIPYQYSTELRMGGSRGFPRTIGNQYLGQTGEAKAKRGVYRIMGEYSQSGIKNGMVFKYSIVKYHNDWKCIIQYDSNIAF